MKSNLICQKIKSVLELDHYTPFKYIDFEIRITDSGCGISEENISKLFMNFGKLHEHAAMNERGTGLGLSICKSLIEQMGGQVRVESWVGVGTVFIVSMKMKCKVVTMDKKKAKISDSNSDLQESGMRHLA